MSSRVEIKLPKMGESVAEATITNWIKKVGDKVMVDETIVEIATDKVDSEVPSEVEGILTECFFKENEVAQIGDVLAIITVPNIEACDIDTSDELSGLQLPDLEKQIQDAIQTTKGIDVTIDSLNTKDNRQSSSRFYSPLVKQIAFKEGLSSEELESIIGTGKHNRVTKDDILTYLSKRSTVLKQSDLSSDEALFLTETEPEYKQIPQSSIIEGSVTELSRMGKIISKHMTDSLSRSAHVQSFIEVDVTAIWEWRDKIKATFLKKEGQKFTFTPIFMEAVAQTLRKFPLLNSVLEGNKIIHKPNINLGMATALNTNDLIVPVIPNADQLSLVGLTKAVNNLADKARKGQLNADDVQNGTYTVTNIGAFGTLMGTPIINQPQSGILAIGAIRKVVSVIETQQGDTIGIRKKLFLSHSYDHRLINGAMGGKFILEVKNYLENWDTSRSL